VRSDEEARKKSDVSILDSSALRPMSVNLSSSARLFRSASAIEVALEQRISLWKLH
jgi:hypothetical protein